MKVRRALFQTGKVTAVFLAFLVVFALFLIVENGFEQFSQVYLWRYAAQGLMTLLLLGFVSFVVSLIPRN